MSADPLTGAAPGNGLATSPTCAGCGAALAPDQRYCLACGRPASPVRLAFLDVLQAEHAQPATPGLPGGPQGGYVAVAPPEPDGALGALRRYSGLLGLLAVLLTALLVGLLVGHWINGGGGASGKQVVELKVPKGAFAVAPAAGGGTAGSSPSSGAGTTTTTTTTGSQGSSAAKSAKSEKAQEAKEVKALKTAKPPVAHKDNTKAVEKLSHTTGKKHDEEANAVINSDEPIETK